MPVPETILTGLVDAAIEKQERLLISSALKAVGKGATRVFKRSADWYRAHTFFHDYLERMVSRLCFIQILRMPEQIQLEDLFVAPRFHTRPAQEVFGQSGGLSERSLRVAGGRETALLGLEAAFRRGRHIAVLGMPGAGKSTLLRVLFLCRCSKSPAFQYKVFGNRFPVYVELRSLDPTKGQLEDSLAFQMGLAAGTPEYATFRRMLKKGKCLLLLDALDEVRVDLQKSAVSMINSFCARYPKNAIVTSCRSAAYDFDLTGFTALEMADFNEIERETFVQNWLRARGKLDLADNLNQAIRTESGLRDISSNPLLVSLLCILYENDRALEKDRAGVYKRCIDVLIREWDASRGFRRETKYDRLSDDRKVLILAAVAQHFYLLHTRDIHTVALLDYISSMVGDFGIDPSEAAAVVREIESHHGILIKVGADTHGFSHYTFQEYLTAYWYYHKARVPEIVRAWSSDRAWREVLLLSAGIASSIQPHLTPIVKARAVECEIRLEIILSCLAEGLIVDAGTRKAITAFAARTLNNYTVENSSIPLRFNRSEDLGITLTIRQGGEDRTKHTHDSVPDVIRVLPFVFGHLLATGWLNRAIRGMLQNERLRALFDKCDGLPTIAVEVPRTWSGASGLGGLVTIDLVVSNANHT